MDYLLTSRVKKGAVSSEDAGVESKENTGATNTCPDGEAEALEYG